LRDGYLIDKLFYYKVGYSNYIFIIS